MQKDTLIQIYSEKIIKRLEEKTTDSPRTYGFEYEFISKNPMTPELLERLYQYLIELGFEKRGDHFFCPHGLYLTFEPGGQIEYHSPPMAAGDLDTFQQSMDFISGLNDSIFENLGIQYMGTGYMAERQNAPLCLSGDRYIHLHNRLASSGTRGLEMMKGTASIHLHAMIRHLHEIPLLFSGLVELSKHDMFKMGDQRRDIWDKTDPMRCGLPFQGLSEALSPIGVIRELVRVSMEASVLGSDKPYFELDTGDFDAFLYHMTTIFTDIRLNLIGPTFEIRTLDSMPYDSFKKVWETFVSAIERKMS